MSKLKSNQVDHNGQPLNTVLSVLTDPANDYTHPLTHPVSMITGALSEAQIDQKIADLVNGAPGTLDTLNEIATALGNDPNLATTLTNQIAGKASMKIIPSTFPSGQTQLVVNDAFVVEATCKVDVQAEAAKVGTWSATFVNGAITVTSDATETTNVPVTIYVTKAGA